MPVSPSITDNEFKEILSAVLEHNANGGNDFYIQLHGDTTSTRSVPRLQQLYGEFIRLSTKYLGRIPEGCLSCFPHSSIAARTEEQFNGDIKLELECVYKFAYIIKPNALPVPAKKGRKQPAKHKPEVQAGSNGKGNVKNCKEPVDIPNGGTVS